MKVSRINIPQIASVETAVNLYDDRIALSNKDIGTLFPTISKSRVIALKKVAKEKAEEMGRMEWSSATVITECAYLAWGLDIDSMRKRLTYIRKRQA